MDNFIGRAEAKRDETIVSRREDVPKQAPEPEEAKSFFYPPDEDEPQEIVEIEARIQEAVENSRKIFGTPVFEHESGFRVLTAEDDEMPWDMLAEAVPLDILHTVDEHTVNGLMQGIREDPPSLPLSKAICPTGVITTE